MCAYAQSKKVIKSSERNWLPPLSLDKEEPGGDRTELPFTARIMPELLLTIKDKPRVALLLVQWPRKPQNFGLKSHPTPVQSSDHTYLNSNYLFVCCTTIIPCSFDSINSTFDINQ
jgi:hypothetical protein